MNVKNKALRSHGTIGGVLFSIVLIFALIGSLLFSTSTTLVKPASVVAIIRELDLAEHVLANEEIGQILDREGIQTEMIRELLDSPFFEDTVEVYTKEVVAAIRGKEAEIALTEDVVKQFADEHMVALIALTRKYMPQSIGLTDAQIKEALDKLVDQYSSTLVQALPTGAQVKELLIENNIQQTAELLVSTTVPIVLYTIVAALAAIIFVCLLYKFRGLLCLGIDALIVAAILLVPYLALNNDALVASLLGDGAALVATLIAMLIGKLGIYLIVLTAVGVLFIAGYITHTVLAKKQAAALPEAVELATTEPLPEAVRVGKVAEPLPTEEDG